MNLERYLHPYPWLKPKPEKQAGSVTSQNRFGSKQPGLKKYQYGSGQTVLSED